MPTTAIDALLGETDLPQTLAQTVAQRLRGLIIDGSLPPGTVLRLAPMAKRLGVSMMPVRDALRLLEADNLVVVTPRRGAAVADLSLEDAEEIYALRVALESLCARHAGERLTAADVEELESLFGNMEAAARAGDLSAFIEADHRFHERLYRTSGRDRLVQHVAELVARSRRYIPYLYQAWRMVEDPLDAHRPLLEAIRAGDPLRIEQLTRDHMQAAAGRLLTAISREAEKTGDGGSPTAGRWRTDTAPGLQRTRPPE